MGLARRLRERRRWWWQGPGEAAVERAIAAHEMDGEQQAAVRRAILEEDGDISVWFGIAGAGKTRALEAARDAYRAAGWRVLAAAPTNTVARDLGRAGFEASTTYRLLGQIERGRLALDRTTVVIVDEAAMLSTEQYVRLLSAVREAGARVLLVGDDRQLGSIEPGGLFRELRHELGWSEFRTVRRQKEAWQREATELLADGRMLAALERYEQAGAVRFSETGEEAMRALVAAWKRDGMAEEFGSEPEAVRFAYARTNREVNALNEALREAARELGWLTGPEVTYAAARGEVTLAAGDRVQFRANDHEIGLYNGNVGTVLEAREDLLRVRLDGGREMDIDPRAYTDFTLGYSGTVYRGQGKTQTSTYVLHGAGADRASSYVALTRHSRSVELFAGRDVAPDLKTLARQMGRRVGRGASLAYRMVRAPEIARELGRDEAARRPVPEPAAERTRTLPAEPPMSRAATRDPARKPASEPEPSTEAAVLAEWKELRSAVTSHRALAREVASYRAEITGRLLTATERGATEDGRTLEKAFGCDDEAVRRTVTEAIAGKTWDPEDPVPGYRPRLLGRGAYERLRKAIAESRDAWRQSTLKRIEGLVRDRFAARRAEVAERVGAAEWRVLDRVDAACRPEDHTLVRRLADEVRSANAKFAGELDARAERLRLLLPEAVVGRRRALAARVWRRYGPSSEFYERDDPRRPEAERLGRELVQWIQTAAPEKLPLSAEAHSFEILEKAAEAARNDPNDAMARRVVAASEAHEAAERLERSRGPSLGW